MLPEDLLADEKFTSINGKPMFVATTYARSHTAYWRRYRDFLVFAREHLKGEVLKAVNSFEKKRAELYKG